MKELNKSYGDWSGDTEIGQNPLFQTTFYGFFIFSEKEK
jgi:hypothetical protein